MHKGVIAAGAVLVVFGGAQVASLLLDDEKDAAAQPATPVETSSVVVVPQTPSAPPKPSQSESGMPEPTDTATPSKPTQTTEVAAPPDTVAEQLVTAYYTRSWRDDSLRSWQDAVRALGDEELAHGLVHDYGVRPTRAERDEWRTVIVKPKATTRVSDIDVLPRAATDDGHAVFEVEFTVERMTEKPAADWTYVFEDTWVVDYAWDGEQWLAHSIQVVD